MKINRRRRTCMCGCGEVPKLGNRFVNSHQNKNRKHTNESKVNMSLAHIGHVHSEEHKAKISAGGKGRICSEASRARYSKASKSRTPETLAKIAATLMGHSVSKETREKISILHTGKTLSDEHKLKIAVSLMKPRTDGYCDAWSDQEYKMDMRKSYCEGKDCGITFMMQYKLFGEKFIPHHIDEDKMNCHPDNFMTMCRSCHTKIHNKLRRSMERSNVL